jgi:hypothetical protein
MGPKRDAAPSGPTRHGSHDAPTLHFLGEAHPIGNNEQRAGDFLSTSPARLDLGGSGLSEGCALRDHTANHEERDLEQKDQETNQQDSRELRTGEIR